MKKSLSLSLLLIPSVLFGCGTAARKSGPVQSGLAQYVQQARATSMKDHQSSGSLWTETGNRADPFRDDKAYRVADIVTIAVADNGAGIAPDDHDRIFEAFQRGDNAEPGAGVGLALCRRIVERLGGGIQVRSEIGVGSVFTVTLRAG